MTGSAQRWLGPRLLAALALLVLKSSLAASYSSLIASGDGSSLFFLAPASFGGRSSYQARLDAGGPVVRRLADFAEDASADGATVASTFYGERRCGVAGSTCFLAAPCAGRFSIEGPAGRVEGSGHRTAVRLSGSGQHAWIEQTRACPSIGFTPPPPLRGLYELPGPRLIAAPPSGAMLANTRSGRRVVSNRGQVLLLGGDPGGQLLILDSTGARTLRHQPPAAEAVIDAEGRNAAYVDRPLGRLRWIDVERQTDEDLAGAPLTGMAPALSDDGRLLAFLSPESRLMVYRRETRGIQRIEGNGERILEFTLAGSGRFVFAVTESNRLLRIELPGGDVQTWLEPFPLIQETSTAQERDPSECPLYCYTPAEPLLALGRGSVVIMRGRYLDQEGWRIRIGEREWPLEPVASTAARFQVASDFPTGGTILPLVVFHPRHPLQFLAKAQVVDRAVSCFGALHQNFDRIVSADAPARAGETVHVFLTGLQGEEPVPDGAPNPADRLVPVASPPEVYGNGILETVFFGLAPGLIGLQQLDVRILRQAARDPGLPPPRLFPNVVFSAGCDLPAIQTVPRARVFGLPGR